MNFQHQLPNVQPDDGMPYLQTQNSEKPINPSNLVAKVPPFQDNAKASNERAAKLMVRLAIFMIVTQIMMIVLYATLTDFGADVDPQGSGASTIQQYYPMYQDVHVMIFVGFGFLMTFLRYHMWNSVMMNFLISAFSIQWGILCVSLGHEMIEKHGHKIKLDITYLIEGDFAAGAVMISFGAVLGKCNAFQLLVMAFCECLVYGFNLGLGQKEYKAVDMGGSMYVHTFGAYFGVACAWMLGPKEVGEKNTKIGSSYNSNMFAAIGSIFLWMFWPSFNGAFATGHNQHRVVVNTVMSLSAATMGAFVTSALLCKGKFKMEHCLNATLAGGVMIGSSSDLVAASWVSMIIGFCSGIISCAGFEKINPWLNDKLGMHDTCGVGMLHGIPGIIGGIIGAIACRAASDTVYGTALTEIFPELNKGRTKSGQAGFQLAALGTTLALSISGGLLTGLLIKCPFFLGPNPEECCEDDEFWTVEHDEIACEKRLDHIMTAKLKVE